MLAGFIRGGRLSETGKQVTERFWGIGRERLDPVVDRMDAEQLEIAVRGLEIIRAAEQDAESPSGLAEDSGDIEA